ncbi:unnamed protein product [Mytilus coruscus]|uniref:Chitin-binding type-2 domain-containing protein n=1 Tax=Mytilus coruscus TaxID=42192 RepID=A0A6J8B4G3_MYTCO|nr:unnamed protein product [Mytilus coruscus]
MLTIETGVKMKWKTRTCYCVTLFLLNMLFISINEAVTADTENSPTSKKANPFSLKESSLDTFSDVNISSSVKNKTFLNESNSINEIESNFTWSRNLSVISSEISNLSITGNGTIKDDVIEEKKQLTTEDTTSRGKQTQEASPLCKNCPNEPPQPVLPPPPYPSDEMLSNQNQDMKIIKEIPEFTLNKNFQPRAGRIPQSWIDSKPDIVEATPKRPNQRSSAIKPIIQPIFDPELPPPPPKSSVFGKKEMVSITDSKSSVSDLTAPITTEDLTPIEDQQAADFQFPLQPEEVVSPENSQPFKVAETASNQESLPSQLLSETVSMDQKLTSFDIQQPLNPLDEEPPPPPPHFDRSPTIKFKQDKGRLQSDQNLPDVLNTSPPEILQPGGQQFNAAFSEQSPSRDQQISDVDKQILDSVSDQMLSHTIEKQTPLFNTETLPIKRKAALESDKTVMDQQLSFIPDELQPESQQLLNTSEAEFLQTNVTTFSESLSFEKQNLTDHSNPRMEKMPTTSLLEHMPSLNQEAGSEFTANSTAEFTEVNTTDFTVDNTTVDNTTEFTVDNTPEFTINNTTEFTVDNTTVDNTPEFTVDNTTEFTVDNTTEFTVDSTVDQTIPISEINQLSETINNTMNEEIALPLPDQLQSEQQQQLNNSMESSNQLYLDILQPEEWLISENENLMQTLEQNITGSEQTAEIKALNLSAISKQMSVEGQLNFSVDQKLMPPVLDNVISEDQKSADTEGAPDKNKNMVTSISNQEIFENGSLPIESVMLEQLYSGIKNSSGGGKPQMKKQNEEFISGHQQPPDANITQLFQDNERVNTTMENEMPTENQTITDTNGTTAMLDQLNFKGQHNESLILEEATDQQLEPSLPNTLIFEDNELLDTLKTVEDFSEVPKSDSQPSQNTSINDTNQTQSILEQIQSDGEHSLGTNKAEVEMLTEDIKLTTLKPDPVLNIGIKSMGIEHTTKETTPLNAKHSLEVTTSTQQPLRPGQMHSELQASSVTDKQQQTPVEISNLHEDQTISRVDETEKEKHKTFPENTQPRQDQKKEQEFDMMMDIPPPPPRRRTEFVEKENYNLPPSLNVLDENRRTGIRQFSKQPLQSPELPSELPPPAPGSTKHKIKHITKDKSMALPKETSLLKSQQNETAVASQSIDQSKYLALFNRNSQYYQSMWKINKKHPSTKTKAQTSLNSNNQRQSSNNAVRNMINIIEQVRTRPKKVDSLTFFAPGVQRTQTNHNTNLNSNLKKQRSIPTLSKQTSSQQVVNQKRKQSIGFGIPSAGYLPGVPYFQNHILRRKRWNKRNLPRKNSQRIAHMAETTEPPVVRQFISGDIQRHIAFKTAVPNQEQSDKQQERMTGRKKYVEENVYSNIPMNKRYSINDLRISKLNRLNDINKYSDVEYPKNLEQNVDIYFQKNGYNSHQTVPQPKNQIKDFILHGKVHRSRKLDINHAEKVRANFQQNKKIWNKNDDPPPIILRTADATVFKVSYTPPPPPPRKYKPPTVPSPNEMNKPLLKNKLLSLKQFKSKGRKSNNVTKTSESTESYTKSVVSVIGNSLPEINPSYTKELSNASETCVNCTYVSNFCYMREPTNCNRFIVCYKQGHKLRATEKECSFGLFWSESKLACTQSSRADCEIDPCRTKGVRSHPYIGKCRAYWTCRRRRSDARCCPNGYAYGVGRNTCVPSNDCKTDCYTKTPEVFNVCPLRKVSDSPFEYTDGGMVRSCAPGTRFEESMCACIRSNVGNRPVEKKQTHLDKPFQCEPAISLDFSGSSNDAFDDKSGHSQSIGVSNVVQTVKKQAMFNGHGSLKLWRFSNVELGPEFALRFKFYAHGRSHRSETLLSNCIGKKKAAFDIRLETDILEIVFTVKTSESPEAYIRIFYKPYKWNEVILRYDGASFSAALGKVSKTIFVEGVIPTKHAAISVGGCDQNDGFIGYMDDVIIYNGCIPEDVRGLVFE